MVYPTGISSLGGCVNDVRLQYELLVHRYGFNPQDIVIVTDEGSARGLNLAAGEIVSGATRDNIISRFRSHLIEQAKADDVVVFHYSGHGSYVTDPHPIDYSSSPAYLDIPGYENFDELRRHPGAYGCALERQQQRQRHHGQHPIFAESPDQNR
jgi:hypothetical protein